MAAAQPRRVLAVAERAHELAQQVGGPILVAASIVLAEALILVGRTSAARELLSKARASLEDDDLTATAQIVGAEASFFAVLGDYERSRQSLSQLIATGRKLSAPGLLVYPLATLAQVDFITGRWRQARAEASEGADLGRETGQTAFLAWAHVGLARLDAAQGNEHAARKHLATAHELADPGGVEIVLMWAHGVAVLLDLGSGELDSAADQGVRLSHFAAERGYGEPGVGVGYWFADAIEACVRVGRTTDGEKLLRTFETQAQTTKGGWALGAAARCRGLLADDASFEAEFEQALRLQEKTNTPFERARTQLCLGERLRRARRRSDARTPLRSALATLELLGATPWVERTRSELRACGGRPPTQSHDPLEDLTTHELQVALVVGQGSTNKEAAAKLFISPKTVDYHLRNIYGKLGIRSRAQLARIIAHADTAALVMRPNACASATEHQPP
jgi:ATP/maltotriose-dependent transcriptional regulator MalT